MKYVYFTLLWTVALLTLHAVHDIKTNLLDMENRTVPKYVYVETSDHRCLFVRMNPNKLTFGYFLYNEETTYAAVSHNISACDEFSRNVKKPADK